MTDNTNVANTTTNSDKKVDIVMIDKNDFYLKYIAKNIEQQGGKVVDTYLSISKFLPNLDKYSKDTKICMSYVLGPMNGIELAKKLHEAGYTKLYLHTAWFFMDESVIPDYLVFVPKLEKPDIIEVLLKD